MTIFIVIIIIILAIIFSTASYYKAEPYTNNYTQEETAIVETMDQDINIEDFSSYTGSEYEITDHSPVETTEITTKEETDLEYQDPYIVIESALRKRESSVKVLVDHDISLTWSDLYALSYGSFWVSKFGTTGTYYDNGSLYQDFHFTYYDLTDEEIESMRREIDDVVNGIISQTPTTSEYDACLYVHDELARICTYDHSFENPHIHDLYGALVLGSAVCSGYSSAYCHILRQLGLETQIVSSDTHSWNKIGESYVDPTWNDLDRVTDDTGEALISHYWFGVSKEQVELEEHHKIVAYSYNSEFNEYTLPNYFETEGYILDSYDYDSAKTIFYDQYSNGEVFPTIAFSNEEAYSEFLDDMESDFWPVLLEMGYDGDYFEYYRREDLMTWSFALSTTTELD